MAAAGGRAAGARGAGAARALALAFCVLVLLAPRAATAGARDALESWWQVLVPALLPFLLAAEAFLWGSLDGAPAGPVGTAVARLAGLPPAAGAPLVAGLIGGYPVGAALADRWARAGRLTRQEAARLAALACVPDPLLVAAVWTPTLTRQRLLGLGLLAAQYAALVPVALWLRRRSATTADGRPPRPVRTRLPRRDPLLDAAVAAGRTLLLAAVAAAVVGAAAAAARALLHAGAAPLVPAAWRQAGAGALDALLLARPAPAGLDPVVQAVLASGLLALGGAALWLEAWALTRPSRLDMRPFFTARLIQAAAAGPLAYAAVRLDGHPVGAPAALAALAGRTAEPAAAAVVLACLAFGLALILRPTQPAA